MSVLIDSCEKAEFTDQCLWVYTDDVHSDMCELFIQRMMSSCKASIQLTPENLLHLYL